MHNYLPVAPLRFLAESRVLRLLQRNLPGLQGVPEANQHDAHLIVVLDFVASAVDYGTVIRAADEALLALNRLFQPSAFLEAHAALLFTAFEHLSGFHSVLRCNFFNMTS